LVDRKKTIAAWRKQLEPIQERMVAARANLPTDNEHLNKFLEDKESNESD
jgi:hypothetical protein